MWTGILWGISMGRQNAGSTLSGTIPQSQIQQAIELLLFVLLQQCLFARMYGRADSHAFSVCALAGCHWQGELLYFLIHMLSAVILLAAVQMAEHNVTRRGRLRTPKPFIPYIVFTFWAEILWLLWLRAGSCR